MAFLEYFTYSSYLSLAIVFSLLYFVGIVVSRLYLSPLAKFPGPKLAALTLWYEFYYDVIKGGKYTWEIGRMHWKYGPIVRINPYELHIDDPDYYDELYSGPSKKRDKWAWSAKMFGNSTSMLGTVPHDHHRLRRAALNPFFSKRAVMRLEPVIRSVVENLCARLKDFQRTGEPVNLGVAYSALTMDIITEYSFSKSFDCVAEPDFAPEWAQVLDSVSESTHINKQFGWLLPLMRMMPIWLIRMLNPNMMRLIGFQKPCLESNNQADLFAQFCVGRNLPFTSESSQRCVIFPSACLAGCFKVPLTGNAVQDLATQIQAIMDGKNEGYQSASHPTIFHELLNGDLPASEKTLPRLMDEGQTIVGAGQVTTAHYLRLTSFHLLANPDILKKLKTELASAMPDPESLAPLQKLEQLPYLSAVISEGFRMSYGVSSRLQRVSPDAPLIFRDWIIPAGTPVGMTSIFLHDNPKFFPEPHEFRAERWLNPKSRDRLEKYLVNFSRGTRACLGMNLAYAEIYLTLAAIFRRFDLHLYETTRDDVDVIHDFFNPLARRDSKGVRVICQPSERDEKDMPD